MDWLNKATSQTQGQDESCSFDLCGVQIIDRAELSMHQQSVTHHCSEWSKDLYPTSILPHFMNISSFQLTSATRNLETQRKDTIKILVHSE